ncbi:methylcobamide--CoM methyltransferase, partial [Parabacteroides distasonis]|nr:methylcobamide--CoM methyltransferase [Parabacteroides distasonis]
YPNFILSSGCDIPPLVPSNNIDAFYQALEEYNNN